MSQRGHSLTICGIKVVDRRHPQQNGTGKLMNQSPSLYTPTMCCLQGEKRIMKYFHQMVEELSKVETDGFIEVNGKRYTLNIKVGIVGDKSFMWKCTGRGQGSARGQICWMGKCSALQRHKVVHPLIRTSAFQNK